MKKLVLFYTRTGNSRKIAEQVARENGADLVEIKELKTRGNLYCYTIGCYHALRGAKAVIQPINANLKSYDQITIVSPVWAGHQVPAINAAIEALPAGKKVDAVLVSMSGGSKHDKIETMIKEKKCTVLSVRDVKG